MTMWYRSVVGVVLLGGGVAWALAGIPSEGLPGHAAAPDLVASIRAGTWGNCTATENECHANRPESITCLEEVEGGTCTSASSKRACGTCDGPEHETCDGTVEITCTETARSCCQTRNECKTQQVPGGAECKCIVEGMWQWMGLRIDC